MLTSIVLAAFYLVIAFLAPGELPWLFQRMVGITNGLLVLLVVLFAFEDYKRRRWQPAAQRPRVALLVRCAAVALCMLTLAWWLSPAAPIKIAGQPARGTSALE